MKDLDLQVFSSQRFTSARGNKSLIDLVKLKAARFGDRFVLRITIELRCFATIEAWSKTELGWKEIHTIPGPLVPETIDQALAELTRISIEIIKN